MESQACSVDEYHARYDNGEGEDDGGSDTSDESTMTITPTKNKRARVMEAGDDEDFDIEEGDNDVPKFEAHKLLNMSKRMTKWFDWDADTFELAERKHMVGDAQ